MVQVSVFVNGKCALEGLLVATLGKVDLQGRDLVFENNLCEYIVSLAMCQHTLVTLHVEVSEALLEVGGVPMELCGVDEGDA